MALLIKSKINPTECAKHLGVLRTTLDNHLRNKYLNNKFSDFKIIKFFNNGTIN